MSAVPRDRARLVYERARGACEYCGVHLTSRAATIDHWMPRYRNGGDSADNLRCACEPCNVAKGNLHPDAWTPIAAARRAARGETAAAVGWTKTELLQRCAERWREHMREISGD